MGGMLSPGVQVNEINLSVVVPKLGNSTACFAGEFTKGPSGKYSIITNGKELISVYGEPTNENYNDWFQAYNFLQYANKLLVSRAVDANGTFTETENEVYAVNEKGKVEITKAPKLIKAGSFVKFDKDAETDYKVLKIEDPVEAVAQVIEFDVTDDLEDGDEISIVINDKESSYTADGDKTKEEAAEELANDIENDDNGVTATNDGAKITVTAKVAGNEITTSDPVGVSAPSTVVENVEAENYELVLDSDEDFTDIAPVGAKILIKHKAFNAIACAPKDATYNADGEVEEPASELRAGDELKVESILVQNEDEYETMESSIPVYDDTKLKFIAKSSGPAMNKIQIALAREKDFESGKTYVFDGLILNDFFETKPLESKKEIAVIIRYKGKVTGKYIVSLIPGSKDYRNKSNYIEDIINKYDELLYVKNNEGVDAMPQSRLFSLKNSKPLVTSNGTEGMVNKGDIEMALGNVSDATIFGNKESVDIDIVIANEKARVACGKLAKERADCICFIGSKFEDVVGLSSVKIVENVIADVKDGEMNNSSVANSFNAYFGNYKLQYDKYNDKNRWVSVAGDVAGLRADVNTKLDSWWANAGLERGQIKNAIKLAFSPNAGQRDFLYKNKINPIVSFPGQGNAIVWGQKTLESKPSSFDRINVRGLFNTLERSIARMAKYTLFEFNDVFTRNRFVGAIKPFMDSVKAGRGVYDYYIQCNEDNNPPEVVDSNQFVATIAVKPTRVAEFIELNFVAVGTGVDFKEIFV